MNQLHHVELQSDAQVVLVFSYLFLVLPFVFSSNILITLYFTRDTFSVNTYQLLAVRSALLDIERWT